LYLRFLLKIGTINEKFRYFNGNKIPSMVFVVELYDDVMTGKLRPKPAGHDCPLYGDEYVGMKVGNVLLIQIVLSYCLLFGV
jgi:hypothetical protein